MKKASFPAPLRTTDNRAWSPALEKTLSLIGAPWSRLLLVSGVCRGCGKGGIVGCHAALSVDNISSFYWSRGSTAQALAWPLELDCFMSNPGSAI